MSKSIKFLDPAIKRKSNLAEKNLFYFENVPLPAEVEISESGTCNRTCSFCPRSAPGFEDKKEFIKTELFEKLCKQLCEVDYRGTIRFSGFVEPLLDKNIYNIVAMARKYLENANIEMVTNGDVLNIKRLKKLIDSGLNTLLISVYDGKEEANNFQKMCEKAGLNKSQYVIRHRYLPPEEDFGITMSNRAGMMKNAEYQINPLEKSLSDPCYYPHYTFFMDYNGDALMCPHDWGKKRILGNLKSKSFMDIWKSNLAILTRSNLKKGNRNFSPCNVCDVKGTLIGKTHADAWENLK
jgi:radical SAM protein with 4Fe4S-binding SPASM domain|tara:strand:- start:9527 stop:10411 length:885 start_codon:yes stop_codon:yes gene_type:complete